MKTLYESILSSTHTGGFGIKKQIENCEFTPELVKILENKVAFYKPHNDEEFIKLIERYIKAAGNNCRLNWIDTSEITDMWNLFSFSTTHQFNGDISKWDVSNVEIMTNMFDDSDFNGNISDWDVSNVIDMAYMFSHSKFNKNISEWDVSHVINMSHMFSGSDFNGNISKWDVSNVGDMSHMFENSKKFNSNISEWDVKNVNWYGGIFNNCPIKKNYKPKKFR